MVGGLNSVRNEKKYKVLQKAYTSGPTAYGSIKNLQRYTKFKRKDVVEFLHSKDSYTRYRTPRRRFPRLKTIAYRINEIWSCDLAYVDKLTKFNNNVKYLFVAVDVLSRYLRVQPMKTKSAESAVAAFKKMLNKRNKPEKVWTDKGTEFKGAFEQFCGKRGIDTYTTNSETKSAFAERNIRSLKFIIWRYMHEHETWKYLPKLQDFVKTINTRVNRVTKLAPAQVQKKHVPQLVALAFPKVIKKPKLKVGNTVRISKEDIAFRKGYKPQFTEELFTITGVNKGSPPTYQIQDLDEEPILGKFYESELIKVIATQENGRRL